MTKYIDKTKYKNKNKRILEGFAIIDKEGDVLFTDYDFTEKQMRQWYLNQLKAGFKVAKMRLEIIEELSPD